MIKNSPRLGVFEIEDVEDGIGHEDQAFSSRGNFHCHVTRGMAGRGDCRHTRKGNCRPEAADRVVSQWAADFCALTTRIRSLSHCSARNSASVGFESQYSHSCFSIT